MSYKTLIKISAADEKCKRLNKINLTKEEREFLKSNSKLFSWAYLLLINLDFALDTIKPNSDNKTIKCIKSCIRVVDKRMGHLSECLGIQLMDVDIIYPFSKLYYILSYATSKALGVLSYVAENLCKGDDTIFTGDDNDIDAGENPTERQILKYMFCGIATCLEYLQKYSDDLIKDEDLSQYNIQDVMLDMINTMQLQVSDYSTMPDLEEYLIK